MASLTWRYCLGLGEPHVTTKPEPNGPQSGQPEETDLLDYALLRDLAGFVLVRAPRRHKVLAGVSFLAVVALAVLALQLLPKIWEVQTTLLAQGNPLILGAGRDTDRMRAARELVLRRDNLVAIAEQTGFVERHMASRSLAARARERVLRLLAAQEPTPEERLEDLVNGMESKLWVLTRAEGTITIGFEWSNRELAFDVVKAALQNFIEVRKATEVDSFSETRSILESHVASAQREIAVLSQRLADKERQLRSSRAQKRPAPRIRMAPDVEVAKLDALLDAKKRTLRSLEEARERRLSELRSELVQQQLVYTPAHPVVAATKKTVDALSQRSPELEKLRVEIGDLEREITSRGSRPGDYVKLVQADLVEARLRLDDDDPRLEQERHELGLAFRNYSNLLSELAAARVSHDTASAGFKYRYSVISPPQLPKNPIRPKPLQILAMAVVGGWLFALFAATATDLRGGLVAERWQIESQLGIPVLAELQDRQPPA